VSDAVIFDGSPLLDERRVKSGGGAERSRAERGDGQSRCAPRIQL
jgi:hypothetical protein